MQSKHTEKVRYLRIYSTQIWPSDNDIIAILGQWLDIAGYHDSRHGFSLATCEVGYSQTSMLQYTLKLLLWACSHSTLYINCNWHLEHLTFNILNSTLLPSSQWPKHHQSCWSPKPGQYPCVPLTTDSSWRPSHTSLTHCCWWPPPSEFHRYQQNTDPESHHCILQTRFRHN